MNKKRGLLVVAALVGAVVFAASAFGRTSAHPTLIGIVGKDDAYKITLTMNGKLIKTLKAGTYTVAIHDDSSITITSSTGLMASRGSSPPCRSSERRRSRSSSCPASTRPIARRTSR
jgi:hypothetical protein